MNDELGALSAFVAVAELRSFTRAASQLRPMERQTTAPYTTPIQKTGQALATE